MTKWELTPEELKRLKTIRKHNPDLDHLDDNEVLAIDNVMGNDF